MRAEADGVDGNGHGIRLGDFVLHSSLASSVGYMSNVFYSDNAESAGALRVMPRLELKSVASEDRAGAGAPPLTIAASAGGSFQTYFSTGAQAALSGNLGLAVTLNPERPVSFVIQEAYQRSATPFTESGLGGKPGSAPDYARNQNLIGGHLVLQTKGGLLTYKVGYRLGLDWFDAHVFESNDNTTHTVDMHTNWEFFPKTSLFHEASLALQRFPSGTTSTTSPVFDSDTVSTRIGINGGISSRVGGTLAVGYTAGFYDSQHDVEGLTLNAEVRYRPEESSEFGLGYERSISQAFQGGFVGKHRVYVRTRWALSKAFFINGKTGVEFLKFGAEPQQQNKERTDTRIFADAAAEYRFLSWLAVSASGGWVTDITKFTFLVTDSAGNTSRDPAKYTAFQAWLGVRAFY